MLKLTVLQPNNHLNDKTVQNIDFRICTQPIISKFFHTEVFPEQCIYYNTSEKLDFGDVSFHKNPCIRANPFTKYFYCYYSSICIISRKHMRQGFLTKLVFMGGCGCLLIFYMLKRHVETKKPLHILKPKQSDVIQGLFHHIQPKTDKALSGLLGVCAQSFQKCVQLIKQHIY